MDSLNQIAQDLISLVRAKRVDDYNVTAAQVKRWIIDKRSRLIEQEINKNRILDEDYIQDLGCVSLEKVNVADCGPSCVTLRTCKKIPNPIVTISHAAITRVGPVDLTSQAFSLVSYNAVPYVGNGRFTSNQVFAYYLNGYIYLKLAKSSLLLKNLKVINIRGIFENPEDVKDFTHCDGSPCYELNTPFPIKKKMKDQIIDMILEQRFPIAEQGLTDSKNDEADLKEV